MEPKINNLKISIVISNAAYMDILKNLNQEKTKEHKNFLVIKDNYTYIIFPNHINITGIKSIKDLENVKTELCKTFFLDPSLLQEDTVIDNITANGSFKRRLDLAELKKTLNSEKNNFKVDFDRNYFPGAFCKTYKCGTIILFASGKYVIVGAKCPTNVTKIYKMMLVHISRHGKITIPPK